MERTAQKTSTLSTGEGLQEVLGNKGNMIIYYFKGTRDIST